MKLRTRLSGKNEQRNCISPGCYTQSLYRTNPLHSPPSLDVQHLDIKKKKEQTMPPVLISCILLFNIKKTNTQSTLM